MIKSTVLALVAFATLGAASTSTFAAAEANSDNDFEAYSEAVNLSFIQTRLEHQGLDVSSVENWGTYVRAFVVDSDGKLVQQFFDRDTLVPVDVRSN